MLGVELNLDPFVGFGEVHPRLHLEDEERVLLDPVILVDKVEEEVLQLIRVHLKSRFTRMVMVTVAAIDGKLMQAFTLSFR